MILHPVNLIIKCNATTDSVIDYYSFYTVHIFDKNRRPVHLIDFV